MLFSCLFCKRKQKLFKISVIYGETACPIKDYILDFFGPVEKYLNEEQGICKTCVLVLNNLLYIKNFMYQALVTIAAEDAYRVQPEFAFACMFDLFRHNLRKVDYERSNSGQSSPDLFTYTKSPNNELVESNVQSDEYEVQSLAEPVDINGDGVLKQVLREGQGPDLPPPGSKVKVHYTGTLLDGTQFDSSRDRGEPFEFDLGKGSVIKAWDLGVACMKRGEQAILTCPPKYAYGSQGSHSIPPDATLKFDIEVIDWKGEDLSPQKDGSIERYQISPGEGFSTPNDGAMVEVKLIGKYENRIFDDRELSFSLGEGSDSKLIEGVEKALEKFKKGETSRLIIKPKLAFGTEGNTEFNIPPNATVEYEVTLKSFEKAKESWSLDSEEKVEQGKLFKEKGTNYFKAGKLKLALKMYKKVLSYLEFEKDAEGPHVDERKSLILSANLNLALCHLKLNEPFEAKSTATAALEVDAINEKALFRRGQAYLLLGEAQLAADDFNTLLKIEPNNTAAKAQLAACNKTLKEQLQKEKKIYANMFDKFAKMDTQREEEEKKKEPDVMSSLGEWGKEDREREPTEFEKENPNILMLNGSGEFQDM